MANSKSPKVFISYAWEEELKTWVLEFATRLRLDGIDAILDQWAVQPGDPLTQFMEKAVRESDFVVFICTPIYKRKSDRRKGGVGYEGGIITGEVFAKNNHRKFIPVLREGKWKSAAPSWAVAKLFIDLRGNPYSNVSYQQLLDTLLGRFPSAPPVRDDKLPITVVDEDIRNVDSERIERDAKSRLEAEDFARQKAVEEAEREAAEKAAREKAAKIEKEIQREVEKRIKKAKRELQWERFKTKIQYWLDIARIYAVPNTLFLVGIVFAVYMFMYYSKNISPLNQFLNPTPQSSQISTETFIPTKTFTLPPPTLTFSPASPTETKTPTTTFTPTITNTPTPLPTTIIDIKGVEMVLIPAGAFIMGYDKGTTVEDPQGEKYVDAFYIDKYEITNKLYKECVAVGVCKPPNKKNSSTHTDYYENSQFNDYPVINVDWHMAVTYCSWRDARLPTEPEWEKAARGEDGRIYPWGNEPSYSYANYYNYKEDTTAVGSYEEGKSVYGVYDMGGNVREWTSSLFMVYPYKTNDGRENPDAKGARTFRGGAWSSASVTEIRTTYRSGADPSSSFLSLGFRCARSQ